MTKHLQRAARCVRARSTRIAVGAAVAALAAAPAASAHLASVADLAHGSGPLAHIYLGNEFSCQVQRAGDSTNQFYPPTPGTTTTSKVGDCGTFLASSGLLYGPFFDVDGDPHHDTTHTPYKVNSGNYRGIDGPTPLESGSGTAADPYQVTTSGDADVFHLVKVDKYVAGQDSYTTQITVTNNSGSSHTADLYQAGDCFAGGSNDGFGYQPSGGTACSSGRTADGFPTGSAIEYLPQTGGASSVETSSSNLWSLIGNGQLPNTCLCAQSVDNGAGVAWHVALA